MFKSVSPYCVLILLFLMLTSIRVQAIEYEPSSVKMNLKPVSEHVYYVQGKAGIATDNEGFISNSTVILTEKGIVIVDALGSPSLANLLLQKIKKISHKPVVKVILTHYHADHIYGLQVFKSLGAEIIAPAGYLEYFESAGAQNRLQERQVSLYPWVNEETRLVKADTVIDKNTTINMGNITLELNYLSNAHSDGDLSVLVKQDQVLITGDLIFEGRIPFTGSANTKHWLSLLDTLKGVKLKSLIPGHGAAANNPDQAIKLTRRYLHRMREVMAVAVDDLMPFDEAFAQADWSEFEHLPAFKSAHRKNAYGVYLSLEQELLDQ